MSKGRLIFELCYLAGSVAVGAVCGMIPVVNLVVLGILLRTVGKEIRVENDKLLLNRKRQGMQICETKYPILLVHGVKYRH